MIGRAHIGLGGVRVHRAYTYFLLNMFAGLLMLVQNHVQPFMPRPYVVGGLLFNLAVLVML